MNKISPPTLWLSLTAIGLLFRPDVDDLRRGGFLRQGQESRTSRIGHDLFRSAPRCHAWLGKRQRPSASPGRKLYFDTLLSKNNTQSCNSCHRVDQGLGGVDNAPGSTGAFGGVGDRNAPTVLNAGFQLAQFWDGRAADLQAQAKGPVLNPGEMAMPSEEAVLDRLRMDDTYEPCL